MFRAFSVAATALLLAACGAESSTSSAGPGAPTPTPTVTTPSAAPTETPTAAPTPTPTPVSTPSPSTSGSPVAACYPLRGGTAARATVTDVRVGAGAGYERLVVEFDRAVPFYELFPNPDGAVFNGGPKAPVTVAGSSWVTLRFTDIDVPSRFAHGTDLTPRSAVLEEVAVVSDYEGVTVVGIGLNRGVCPTVSTLAGPPRLVIDFPTG